MTRMLVRVLDGQEAALADAAGTDIIEVDAEKAGEARAAFAGPIRLRLDRDAASTNIWEAAASVGADEIVVDFDPASKMDGSLGRVGKAPDVVARVAISLNLSDVLSRVRGCAEALMLDTGATRLLDIASIAELDAFAEACRAQNLPFGFGGGLEAPDVARLLLLEPDVLGFDSAVRIGHDPKGALDPNALLVIRSLIPRKDAAVPSTTSSSTVVDRVFVRDLVVPVSIGAYRAEHGGRQRVRFSVDVAIARAPRAPRDMGDVFSYDIIIETIRVRAARAHVAFVETLAEDVAAALLAHDVVRSTTVKVEKLDVIDGAVGIEIHRHRDA